MAVQESQVYHDLMRLKPDEWTPNAWAVNAGVSRAVWADMRRHGNPSRRTLEKLLVAAGSSLAEFEALRIGEGALLQGSAKVARQLGDPHAPSWRGAALQPIPLLASASAGRWPDQPEIELTELHVDQIVAQLARPVSLAGDRGTYAFSVAAQGMWPRFRLDRRLAVSPSAAIAEGDDALVRLKAAGDHAPVGILIGELVQRTDAGLELRQFNPELVFRVPQPQIAAVHKIVGELI